MYSNLFDQLGGGSGSGSGSGGGGGRRGGAGAGGHLPSLPEFQSSPLEVNLLPLVSLKAGKMQLTYQIDDDEHNNNNGVGTYQCTPDVNGRGEIRLVVVVVVNDPTNSNVNSNANSNNTNPSNHRLEWQWYDRRAQKVIDRRVVPMSQTPPPAKTFSEEKINDDEEDTDNAGVGESVLSSKEEASTSSVAGHPHHSGSGWKLERVTATVNTKNQKGQTSTGSLVAKKKVINKEHRLYVLMHHTSPPVDAYDMYWLQDDFAASSVVDDDDVRAMAEIAEASTIKQFNAYLSNPLSALVDAASAISAAMASNRTHNNTTTTGSATARTTAGTTTTGSGAISAASGSGSSAMQHMMRSSTGNTAALDGTTSAASSSSSPVDALSSILENLGRSSSSASSGVTTGAGAGAVASLDLNQLLFPSSSLSSLLSTTSTDAAATATAASTTAEGTLNRLTLADLQGALAGIPSTTTTTTTTTTASSSSQPTNTVVPRVVLDLADVISPEAIASILLVQEPQQMTTDLPVHDNNAMDTRMDDPHSNNTTTSTNHTASTWTTTTMDRLLEALPPEQRSIEFLEANLRSPPFQQTLRALTRTLLVPPDSDHDHPNEVEEDDDGEDLSNSSRTHFLDHFASLLANFQLSRHLSAVETTELMVTAATNPIQAFLDAIQLSVDAQQTQPQPQDQQQQQQDQDKDDDTTNNDNHQE